MMMKWLRVLVVILVGGGLISALPLETEGRSRRLRRNTGCKPDMCPAGQYRDDDECTDCPTGFYTKACNTEHICHSCYKDCRPELHMQVVKNCSKTSDMVCECMDGYVCSNRAYLSKQCTACSPIPASTSTTTSAPTTTTTTTTTSTNTEPSSTQDVLAKEHAGVEVWIVVVVLLSAMLSIFITLHLYRRRKQYLKKLVKRCSHTNPKGSVATTTSQETEPIMQTQPEKADLHLPTPPSYTSDIPIPQPPSTEKPVLPAGNLGPLHIYGAGTVFVSLMNQFGQNGREKEEEHLQQSGLKESDLCCPSSPPLPLSTEEDRTDSGVFFPFQEQGKECHMSKEEGLY